MAIARSDIFAGRFGCSGVLANLTIDSRANMALSAKLVVNFAVVCGGRVKRGPWRFCWSRRTAGMAAVRAVRTGVVRPRCEWGGPRTQSTAWTTNDGALPDLGMGPEWGMTTVRDGNGNGIHGIRVNICPTEKGGVSIVSFANDLAVRCPTRGADGGPLISRLVDSREIDYRNSDQPA